MKLFNLQAILPYTKYIQNMKMTLPYMMPKSLPSMRYNHRAAQYTPCTCHTELKIRVIVYPKIMVK